MHLARLLEQRNMQVSRHGRSSDVHWHVEYLKEGRLGRGKLAESSLVVAENTITDGACTDALTPELFFTWDPQLFGSCSSCYDDAVCPHLEAMQPSM